MMFKNVLSTRFFNTKSASHLFILNLSVVLSNPCFLARILMDESDEPVTDFNL